MVNGDKAKVGLLLIINNFIYFAFFYYGAKEMPDCDGDSRKFDVLKDFFVFQHIFMSPSWRSCAVFDNTTVVGYFFSRSDNKTKHGVEVRHLTRNISKSRRKLN